MSNQAPANDSPSPSSSSPVLIIGGGISGCALALFLHKLSIPFALFEAYPQACTRPGGVAVGPNGMNVLRALGVSSDLLALGSATSAFVIRNHHGVVLGRQPHDSLTRYSVSGVACSRLAVHGVLLAQMEAAGIQVQYGKRLKKIQYRYEKDRSAAASSPAQSRVVACFEDGSEYAGCLLVGADGVHSATRKTIFPDALPPRYIGLLSIGGAARRDQFTTEELRALTEKKGDATLVLGDASFLGHAEFGVDPDTQDELVAFWSAVYEPVQPTKADIASMTADVLLRRLQTVSAGWCHPYPKLVKLACEGVNARSLSATPLVELPDLPSWHSKQVVLVGDAAHAMTPNSGQGVSMALEDSMCLARMLRDAWYPQQQSGDANAHTQLSGTVDFAARLNHAIELYEKNRRARMDLALRRFRKQDNMFIEQGKKLANQTPSQTVASSSSLPRPSLGTPLSTAFRDWLIWCLFRWLGGLFPWSKPAYDDEMNGYRVPDYEKFVAELRDRESRMKQTPTKSSKPRAKFSQALDPKELL